MGLKGCQRDSQNLGGPILIIKTYPKVLTFTLVGKSLGLATIRIEQSTCCFFSFPVPSLKATCLCKALEGCYSFDTYLCFVCFFCSLFFLSFPPNIAT